MTRLHFLYTRAKLYFDFCMYTVTLPLRYYQLSLVFLSHDLERKSFSDTKNTENEVQCSKDKLKSRKANKKED